MDRLPRQHAAPEVAAAARQGRISAYSIFDASLDHHFALDPEGRVLHANHAQLAQWQIARDQAIGKTLGELGYGREVADNLQQALRAMRINRQSLRVRMDYPGSPGPSRALETVLTPILDETGNLVEVVGVSRDITEPVHRDAVLRARDSRSMALVKLGDQLRTLTTPADLAFAAAQILGETLRVSRCGYATIDAVAETAVVERSWTAPGVESLPRRLHFMRDYGSFIEDLKRGELVVIADAELDPRTRDTTAALKSVSAQAVVDVPVMEEGQLVALLYLNNATARSWSPEELSFVREVADRTRIAVERRRSEHERTQAEQALRESERQLRDADRRKDEFIAMLAHELRNPLVPIRTGVELLKTVSERPALIDTIRPMMERQVGHMVRLIDDLLDVSRITSGKIELQRQHVTLASIVGTAVEANRAAIHAARLHLTVDLPEPHLVLNVDPTRFAQVLSNLLQNATKFTGPGGRIGLSARVEPAGRANSFDLLLSVTDSGVGIAAAMLPRVFELFAQADSNAHSGNTGLGIGLALARRLVEMHGGTISAHSEGVGNGSEFVIKLPMLHELEHVGEVARNLQRDVPDLRVLVIDDNRDAANVMAMLVETLGGAARTAYGGESGLAVALEWRPGVVLLDIGMPAMDGYEVCRRIRRELGNSVGVVALTGWGHERDKQAALQAGFDAHLTKPADPTRLAEVISALSQRPK